LGEEIGFQVSSFQASSFNSFALVKLLLSPHLITHFDSDIVGVVGGHELFVGCYTDDSDLMTLGDDYSVFQLYFPVSLRGPTKKVCHMSKPTVPIGFRVRI
jgi:hypothetical protein